MPKINLLSKETYNKISAGEVVERPFSVVKELVENSIDAGATKIIVEIENGGKTKIKIIDDGCGIEKDDLVNALLPHATSKIKVAEDLDSVKTMGFRGEALASISAVSKVKIISKTNDEGFSYSINSIGGETSNIEEDSSKKGTTIIVEDLFFNVPARQKFLKTDRAEESDIQNILFRLMLANPNIAFTYVVNGKTILQTYGDGLESAMVVLYGAKIIDDTFYIETIKNGIKFKGYIGKQYFYKANRTYQSLFINGRYVQNATINSAITNAYSPYMMKRQYPFYVLSIEMPTEIVDVNVHPTKAEVRFINNQIIYGSVYSVISKVLDGTSQAVDIVKQNQFEEILNNKEITNEIIKEYATQNDIENFKKHFQTFKQAELNDFTNAKSMSAEFDLFSSQKPKTDVVDIFAENKAYLEKLEKKKELVNKNEFVDSIFTKTDDDTLSTNKNIKLNYIGQIFATYLIFESNDNKIYLIDQHAAHERILFDKLMNSVNSNNFVIQPLLLPYTFDVNVEESEFLISKIDDINALGIDFSQFGTNSFKVSAVPIELVNINLLDFFNEVLKEQNIYKKIAINEIFREKLATTACKAAIKAGDELSKQDIDTLLSLLENNLGLKCPHGRPIAIAITKTEIEKWFKRIV